MNYKYLENLVRKLFYDLRQLKRSFSDLEVTASAGGLPSGDSTQYIRGDKTVQTLNQDVVPDGVTNKVYSSTDKTKLAGIATGATNVTNNNQLTNGAGFQTSAQVVTAISGKVNSSGGTLTNGTLASPTFSGTVTGDLTLAGSIIPDANNTRSLGAVTLKYNSIYTNGISSNGVNIAITGLLIPSATNIYDFGSSTLKWKDAYFAGNVTAYGGTFAGGITNTSRNINLGSTNNAGLINFARGTDGGLLGSLGYISGTDGGNLQLASSGGSGLLSFATGGGANRMIISNGGNILMGPTSDDAVNKLQVTGSIKVTGGIKGANYTVSNTNVATSLTIDCAIADNLYYYITLTGNTTLTLSNYDIGKHIYLRVIQGGSGSYTITFPTSVKFPGGAVVDWNTTVGTYNIFDIIGSSTTTLDAVYTKF